MSADSRSFNDAGRPLVSHSSGLSQADSKGIVNLGPIDEDEGRRLTRSDGSTCGGELEDA